MQDVPPLRARFLGRIRDPEGQIIIFLIDGENVVQPALGTTLGGGYIVDSVTPAAVMLRHPRLEQALSIAVPSDGA